MLGLDILRTWATKRPTVEDVDLRGTTTGQSLVSARDATGLPRPSNKLPDETNATPNITTLNTSDDISDETTMQSSYTFYTYTPTVAKEERKLFMGMEIFAPVQRNVWGDSHDWFINWDQPFGDVFANSAYGGLTVQQFVVNSMWGLETVKAAYPSEKNDNEYAHDLWSTPVFPSFCRFMAELVLSGRNNGPSYASAAFTTNGVRTEDEYKAAADTIHLDHVEQFIQNHVNVQQAFYDMIDIETEIQKFTDNNPISMVLDDVRPGDFSLLDPVTKEDTMPIYSVTSNFLKAALQETPKTNGNNPIERLRNEKHGLHPAFMLPYINHMHESSENNVRTFLPDEAVVPLNLWKPLSRCWMERNKDIIDGYIVNTLQYNQNRILAKSYRRIVEPEIVNRDGVFYVHNISLPEFAQDGFGFFDDRHDILDTIELVAVGRVEKGKDKEHPVFGSSFFGSKKDFRIEATTDLASIADVDGREQNESSNPTVSAIIQAVIIPALFIFLPVIGKIGSVFAQLVFDKAGRFLVRGIKRISNPIARGIARITGTGAFKRLSARFSNAKFLSRVVDRLKRPSRKEIITSLPPSARQNLTFFQRISNSVKIPKKFQKNKENEQIFMAHLLQDPAAYDDIDYLLRNKYTVSNADSLAEIDNMWGMLRNGYTNQGTKASQQDIIQAVNTINASVGQILTEPTQFLTSNVRAAIAQSSNIKVGGILEMINEEVVPSMIAAVRSNMLQIQSWQTLDFLANQFNEIEPPSEDDIKGYATAFVNQILQNRKMMGEQMENIRDVRVTSFVDQEIFLAERDSSGFVSEVLRYPIRGEETDWQRDMISSRATWKNRSALTMNGEDWLALTNTAPNESVVEKNTVTRLPGLDGFADYMPNVFDTQKQRQITIDDQEQTIPIPNYSSNRLRVNPNNTLMWGVDGLPSQNQGGVRSYVGRRFVVEQSRVRAASNVVRDFQFDPLQFTMDVKVDLNTLRTSKWANCITAIYSDIYNEDDPNHRNFRRTMNDKNTMKERIEALYNFDPDAAMQTLFIKVKDTIYRVTDQTHPEEPDLLKILVVNGNAQSKTIDAIEEEPRLKENTKRPRLGV